MTDDRPIGELLRRAHVERNEPPRHEENQGYNDDDATEATRLEKRYNKVRPPKAIAPQPKLDMPQAHPFIGIWDIDQRIAAATEARIVAAEAANERTDAQVKEVAVAARVGFDHVDDELKAMDAERRAELRTARAIERRMATGDVVALRRQSN